MSVFSEINAPLANCSGAMYPGVPTPTMCPVSSSRVTAMPKSVIRTEPFSSMSTFAGFRSRCRMPRACAAASASHS